jgi:hypothetical protein
VCRDRATSAARRESGPHGDYNGRRQYVDAELVAGLPPARSAPAMIVVHITEREFAMKRLVIFLFGLATSCAVFANSQQQYCADIAGTWTDTNNVTYTFTQSSAGALGGTVTGAEACQPGTLGGSYEGSGQWSVKEIGPQGDPTCTLTFEILLGTTGCAQFKIVNTDTVAAAQHCLVPGGGSSGENATTFYGWGSPSGPCTSPNPPGCGEAHFQATLKPPPGMTYYNWAGRTVSGVNQDISNAPATCRYPIQLLPALSADHMDSTNTVDDYLGWTNSGPVTDERTGYGFGPTYPIPCGVAYTEVMSMDCPASLGGNQTFESNSNSYEVDSSGIELVRHGEHTSPQTQTYGYNDEQVKAQKVIDGLLLLFHLPYHP